jgi:hypothetical protein
MSIAPSRPSRRCSSESIFSTVTADNSNQKQQLQESTSSAKKVSFNLDENEQYENKQVYEDQCYDLWYSSQDYKDFSLQTAKLVKDLLKNPEKWRIGNAYFEKVITRTYAACCEADRETDQVLTPNESTYLMQCVDAKIMGMEKWAVKAVGEHRSERRSVIRKAVLFVQDDTNGDCEIIRAKSESISLASRLYAKTLATALAGDIKKTSTRSLPTRLTQWKKGVSISRLNE